MMNEHFIRIGDVKREKMVRTINIYYNNRSVAAVGKIIELVLLNDQRNG